MADKSEYKKRANLPGFLKDILQGGKEIGLTALPILKCYNQNRNDPEWKGLGLSQWILADPEALAILMEVCKIVRDKLPDDKRIALIMVLGGAPEEVD